MSKIPQELNEFIETNVLEISGKPKDLLEQFIFVSKGEKRRTKAIRRIKLFFTLVLLSFPFGASIIGVVFKLIGQYDLFLQYDFIPFTINLAILFSALGFYQVYNYYKYKSNKINADFRTKIIPFLNKLVTAADVKLFKNIKIDLRSFKEKQIGEETTIKEECQLDLRHWEYQDNWFSGIVILPNDEEIKWIVEINLHKTNTFFNSSEGNKARVESITKYSVSIHNKTIEKTVKNTVMEYDYKRGFDEVALMDLIKSI